MTEKHVYQLSGRQLLLLAFSAALIAIGAASAVYFAGTLWTAAPIAAGSAELTQRAEITDPSAVSDEQNNIEIYRAVAPGVAFINTTSYTQDWWGYVQEGKGNGSGSVIDKEGHILTNYHVIEGAQKISVNFGGEQVFPATVVGGDPDTDLAVLKIDPPADVTVVPFGDSDKLSVGQKVLAIGNPFGLDRTLTTGVISGLQRPIRARNNRPIDAAIQTDASINPGNSGGPLLDKFGRMIGINSQILAPSGGSVGVGFAVPVNTAKRVIPQLIEFGKVRRPNIRVDGVGIAELVERGTKMPIDKGLLLFGVMRGGPADNAGLRGLSRDSNGRLILGDIITKIDGNEIGSLDDLYRALDKRQIGETIETEIYRGGDYVTIPLRLTQTRSEPEGRRFE